jgi:hypothetical protein
MRAPSLRTRTVDPLGAVAPLAQSQLALGHVLGRHEVHERRQRLELAHAVAGHRRERLVDVHELLRLEVEHDDALSQVALGLEQRGVELSLPAQRSHQPRVVEGQRHLVDHRLDDRLVVGGVGAIASLTGEAHQPDHAAARAHGQKQQAADGVVLEVGPDRGVDDVEEALGGEVLHQHRLAALDGAPSERPRPRVEVGLGERVLDQPTRALAAVADGHRLEASRVLAEHGDHAQVADQPRQALGRLAEEALVVDRDLGKRSREIRQARQTASPLRASLLLTAHRSLTFRGNHFPQPVASPRRILASGDGNGTVADVLAARGRGRRGRATAARCDPERAAVTGREDGGQSDRKQSGEDTSGHCR